MFSASTFFKHQVTTKKEMEDVLQLAGGEVSCRINHSSSDFFSNRKLCCQASSISLFVSVLSGCLLSFGKGACNENAHCFVLPN